MCDHWFSVLLFPKTYENAGAILQLSTTLPTSSGSSFTDNQSFSYDALGRLMWAGNSGTPSGGDHCGSTPGGSTTPEYSQSFSYDVIDRITQGSAGTVSYGDSTHIHAATGLSSIPNPYASYDVMGNMTCRNVDTSGSQSCASGTQTGATMSYDNEGRLTTWTAPGGTTGGDQFLYDAGGNRVLQRRSTTPAGSSTPTITDTISFDGHTDTTISNGITTTTKYYRSGGQTVAEATGTAWSYLVPDLLKNTTLALKGDGTVQAVQLYAPYGSMRYTDGTIPTPSNFTGQRLDRVTGLLYYNARYYDPVGGRFISADTVQNNTTGLDPYAYVADNPVTRIDPTGHRAIMADGGGGSPGVDDPTGLGQLFSDIQDYLNSQNPVVSGVEVDAAVVTAPIWVPIVLGGLLLSIPSDSSESNQSQNTSVSPTPEATPATNTDGAGARCCNFRRPNDRHFFSKIKQKTSAHSDKNTVIMPWVDVNADVAAINSGNVTPVKGVYTVNGRSYGVHENGTLYPTTGDGFVTLSRAEYNALGVYNSFGDTAKADYILSKMHDVTESIKEKALSVYKMGGGK